MTEQDMAASGRPIRFAISDCFKISGHGTVVCGEIESGSLGLIDLADDPESGDPDSGRPEIGPPGDQPRGRTRSGLNGRPPSPTAASPLPGRRG